MSEPKLIKSCPFCGSPGERGRCVFPDMVRCSSEKTPHCPASFGCVSIETWNTRTADAAADKITALETKSAMRFSAVPPVVEDLRQYQSGPKEEK